MPRTTFPLVTTLRSRVIAAAAVLAIAASALAPVSARAEPKAPPSAPHGCPVVDENDKIVGYMEPGTRIGLFYCGTDGEWHFGWLVNARRSGPGGAGQPVLTAQP